MAMYLTAMSAAGLFLAVIVYSELVALPGWGLVRTLLAS